MTKPPRNRRHREATPKPTATKKATPEPTAGEETPEPEFQEFDAANFSDSTVIDNEWYPLQPGTKWVFGGTTTESNEVIPHRLEFTITDLTKEIQGVRTVVAWIEDFSDGELVEKEIAFYAQDNDGNVWYFGEHPEEIAGGRVVAAPTWIAGYADAKAGHQDVGRPAAAGDPSLLPGLGPGCRNGLIMRRWTRSAKRLESPLGCYTDVLVLAESSLDEFGIYQIKSYAKGVGEVQVASRGDAESIEELELVEHTQLSPDALAAVRALALEVGGARLRGQHRTSTVKTAPSQ